eukprot:365615-Chlamydomonas_euryale.AAC.9
MPLVPRAAAFRARPLTRPRIILCDAWSLSFAAPKQHSNPALPLLLPGPSHVPFVTPSPPCALAHPRSGLPARRLLSRLPRPSDCEVGSATAAHRRCGGGAR